MTEAEKKLYQNQWRFKNRERVREYRKKWAGKNNENQRAYNRRYREANREHIAELAIKNNRTLKSRYRHLRKLASRHKLAGFISFSEYSRLVATAKCYYCGGPLPAAGAGLDRIDSSQGYSSANVRPCCKMCNIAKNSHSEAEFREWIKQIYTHWIRETK